MSGAGPDIRPRCYRAVGIVDTKVDVSGRCAEMSFDDYRNLVLEIADITDQLPVIGRERWVDYSPRIMLALHVVRQGSPIQASLRKPLSAEALDGLKNNESATAVLFKMEKKPPPPKGPDKPASRGSRLKKARLKCGDTFKRVTCPVVIDMIKDGAHACRRRPLAGLGGGTDENDEAPYQERPVSGEGLINEVRFGFCMGGRCPGQP
jgi:hypothetical protein